MHGLKDEFFFHLGWSCHKNTTHTLTHTHATHASDWVCVHNKKNCLASKKDTFAGESFAIRVLMSHCSMLVLCCSCPCPGLWVRVCVACHDWCPVCARFRLNAFDKSVSTKRRMTERRPVEWVWTFRGLPGWCWVGAASHWALRRQTWQNLNDKNIWASTFFLVVGHVVLVSASDSFKVRFPSSFTFRARLAGLTVGA